MLLDKQTRDHLKYFVILVLFLNKNEFNLILYYVTGIDEYNLKTNKRKLHEFNAIVGW